jgi:hypothetical protein
MGTFLTTSKMNPALAARVEASVRGRQGRAKASVVRRITAIARLVMVLTIVFGIYSVVTGRRRDRRELERSRADLLNAVHAHGASLTTDDRAVVARTGSWLGRLAGPYEGDLVAHELRTPGALAAALARPTLYIRGPIDEVASPAQVTEAAATSVKDALLLCLLSPPASRAEKVLLEKVRIARSGGAVVEEHSAHVRRLHDAIVGLPILLPPWSERVRTAEDQAELARLRRELDRAPIERAKQAAKAELLLVVLDEPGDGKGPTELDGERAHFVRVVLVDVASERPLLRLRHFVDPGRISAGNRPTYASGLDGCGLAFDVHESVRR